jgi:hypothetical protein
VTKASKVYDFEVVSLSPYDENVDSDRHVVNIEVIESVLVCLIHIGND